ncbi:MAG: peptide-methionine (S)-S-oxide reductase [Saprospiraceae bacterium]|nr:peptide-methionine (S)-S-oxide reductase [Candidatus Defluviibacterium haderslevense]
MSTLKILLIAEYVLGTTGHAEICKITFDTTQISYSELLEISDYT